MFGTEVECASQLVGGGRNGCTALEDSTAPSWSCGRQTGCINLDCMPNLSEFAGTQGSVETGLVFHDWLAELNPRP